MAKLKFRNPKTGLWEETGGTTYTAGNGINISASNVISGNFSGLFESKEIIASTPTAPYNDCNTLPINTCVSYAVYVNFSALANKPSTFNNGTIMTWGAKTGTSIVTQLAVNGSNVMWHRAKYGSTWTAWVQEMVDSSVHSHNYTTISVFDNLGIVGDSFASGATYGVEGVGDGVHYGSAWGRVLSKRNNISVNIFAASGLSTKTWLENSHGLTALQAADPQDLYLLCLGINDNKTGADPIGTVSDINDNDYTQNPSTFFGNYGRIVAQIKIHAPTSKLIFIVPTGYKTNNIGIAISQIAEHYAVPCIRLDDDPFFSSSFYQDNLHTGHPVGITYAGMATAIERLYSKCVIDNPTYFIDYISKYSYTYNNEGNVLTTGDNNLTGQNTFNGAVTVPTPTDDTDAVTKKYVDDKVSGSTSGMKNLKDGTSTDKTTINATNANSVYMNNTQSITEPDDGGDKHTALTSTTAPIASGIGSLAIGSGTQAIGDVSLAEGINTIAGRVRNTSTGERNTASHAEGVGTEATASASHSEGYYSKAQGSNSHVEGFFNIVTSTGISGHAEGRENTVSGYAGHAENFGNTVSGVDSHAEGHGNTASGDYSHVEGVRTVASGEGAHAEGAMSANGTGNTASGKGSHAEGGDTTASGNYGHAEGDRTKATGSAGHAEGCLTTAGYRSHAEGEQTIAGGSGTASKAAHAEGISTQATGAGSHTEGKNTIASGNFAHAEGQSSQASGIASHAGGTSTIAQWDNSTVVGKYNETANLSNTSSDPLFIVGNGTGTSERKNAFEVFTDGSAYVNGKKILAEGETNFLKTITGYDANKVQILSHDANGNITWINSIDTLLV